MVLKEAAPVLTSKTESVSSISDIAFWTPLFPDIVIESNWKIDVASSTGYLPDCKMNVTVSSCSASSMAHAMREHALEGSSSIVSESIVQSSTVVNTEDSTTYRVKANIRK